MTIWTIALFALTGLVGWYLFFMFVLILNPELAEKFETRNKVDTSKETESDDSIANANKKLVKDIREHANLYDEKAKSMVNE